MTVSLVADVAITPLETPLSYLVPEELATTLGVGHLVKAPLRGRTAEGYVLAVGERDTGTFRFPLRPLLGLAHPYPCVNPPLLEFATWAARYYHCSLAETLDTAVPPLAAARSELIATAAGEPSGLRGKVQRELFYYLKEAGRPVPYSELKQVFRTPLPALRALERQGAVRLEDVETQEEITCRPAPQWARSEVSLTEQQASAVEKAVTAAEIRSFLPILLHGVTGSGKTEVYIEAAKAALRAGRGVLILVPEISLTPQLVARFQARLDQSIAVLHSALGRRERFTAWQSLLQGKCQVALGARSGIFAPLPDMGLIIVDEEHDSSYKQQEGIRYHARDLAVVRGKLARCPVILGSATPSLESYYNAFQKKYVYIPLPALPGAPPRATPEALDLTGLKPKDFTSPLVTRTLSTALSETFEARQQAFVLYNRRGFASYLQCDSCGTAVQCPNCSVTFTFHRKKHCLLCHYCGLTQVPPEFCPDCVGREAEHSNPRLPPPSVGTLQQRGAGTERVYEELRSLFPEASLARLDRDVVTTVQDYASILDRVRNRSVDLLVGTQMIAKGHDLPEVTLVGVVDCDTGLHFPDFRASERTYQLLTQAAGRAGRGKEAGRVLLQTRNPSHPSIQDTCAQDYHRFARRELATRKSLGYPPFMKLVRVVASAREPSLPARILTEVRKGVETLRDSRQLPLQILGPAPAPLEKLRGKWRWHLLLKSPTSDPLHAAVDAIRRVQLPKGKIVVVVDIDPQDML